ncbi:unnamed protein product, partial [Symbiodinium pilosum]
ISRAYSLEEATGPLASTCTSTQFEHYPSSAYVSEPAEGEIGVEVCDGQSVTFTCSEEVKDKFPAGVMLGASRPPLSGRMLMRILLHQRSYALGIGVGSESANLRKDPEYDDCFLGLYHGGHSVNVAAYHKRVHRGERSHDWGAETKLAILFNFDDGSMQCFSGLEPFGEAVSMKSDEYWPMVVFWRDGDAASIAMDYL